MTGLFDRDEALGSGPEMPVMPNAAILAAGAHDQADRDTRDHALHLRASGRRALRAPAIESETRSRSTPDHTNSAPIRLPPLSRAALGFHHNRPDRSQSS